MADSEAGDERDREDRREEDGDEAARDKRRITPEIEIAWARAISLAFHDPAVYRRLKANPARVLHKLGADVHHVDVRHAVHHGWLKPSLHDLDAVHEDLEVMREALRGAERSSCCTPSTPTCCPPYTPTCCPTCGSDHAPQPGAYGTGAGQPTSIHLHVPTLGSGSQSFGSSATYSCCRRITYVWVCGRIGDVWVCRRITYVWVCSRIGDVGMCRRINCVLALCRRNLQMGVHRRLAGSDDAFQPGAWGLRASVGRWTAVRRLPLARDPAWRVVRLA